MHLLSRTYPGLIKRKSIKLQVERIAVRDLTKQREGIPTELLTDDPGKVINDPQIDIIVEVIGGIDPARDYLLRAIEQQKSIVTANKALLSEYGDDLFEAANRYGVDLAFEASVAGGIPIIKSLREGLAANRIESLYGILNGTTNYILTKMTDENRTLYEALTAAQEKGYAEADPTMDLNGMDAAQKLIILTRLAYGGVFRTEQILREGIDRIAHQDIEYARELGYTIKLLAIAKRCDGNLIDVRVHPAMIPSGSLMADIKDEFNAIEVVGDAVGTQVFYGKGAGSLPTASAIISDLLDLAERRACSIPSRVCELFAIDEAPELLPVEEIEVPYYLRFVVVDKPGVLAAIAHILAVDQISISSVIQKGRSEASSEGVPLVIMTHEAKERAMRRAIEQINRLDVVKDRVQVLRVEELK
jgi:homoserine dehydrogenase